MLTEIMHHCVFLIIIFSSYSLCILNEKSDLGNKLERIFNPSTQARQSSHFQSGFESTGFIPSNNVGFRFPDKQEFNTNNLNELSSYGYKNPYPNNQIIANNNLKSNPYNLALNTGEYSTIANNYNNYPYQHHANAIPGFDYRHSPNVPNANDIYLSQQASSLLSDNLNKNPYYPLQRRQPTLRRPFYAQAYDNYLFNGQPNYNRRPTPPPLSQSQPVPVSSYSPYQDGHFTAPYRKDLTSSSSVLNGPATYPSQYANQFGNFIQLFGGGGGVGSNSVNPLGSLLNSIGGPFAGGENPLSMQIIRGLENIARNDDLQCVPKVLCQMLGTPSRRAQFPSFITSPVLTRFVASLPSSSPALIFGRAALLGLSGGEYSCARTYPKCPQNEDDILYYLNNHRGGFFKFFSEPDSQQVQETPHQYTTSRPTPSYQQQQESQPSIFNFLTGFGGGTPTTTTTTNTNQGNMNTLMSNAVTNGIGSLFGNIISSFLNGQTATRRNDENGDDENEEEYSDLIELNSTTVSPDSEKIQGRILNNKNNILAYNEPNHNPITFPLETENDNYETQQFQSEFRFPSTSHHRDEENPADDYRRGKKVNFIDSNSHSHSGYGTKMVFPDRTGTGNLRFDNDEYFRVGKILNRHPGDYNRAFTENESYTRTTTTRTPNYNYYTKASYTSSPGNLNRYLSSNFRQEYNQGNKEDTSGNVYVTNGQGVIEYYINPKGQKVYI